VPGKCYLSRDGYKYLYIGPAINGLLFQSCSTLIVAIRNECGYVSTSHPSSGDIISEYKEPVKREVNIVLCEYNGRYYTDKTTYPSPEKYINHFPGYKLLAFKKVTITEGELDE
jgi:hypothetical protein